MSADDEQAPRSDASAEAIARALLAAMKAPMAVLDETGACIAMSPSFAGLVGLEADAGTASRPAVLPDGRTWRLIQPPERRARDTEGMLRSLVDALPALINAKDLHSRYVLMNAFQAQLYGVTPEVAVGLTAGDLLGKDYGSYTGEQDRRVIETGFATPPYEEHYADVGGTLRYFLTTKVPLHDETGRVSGVGTISVDIGEHKRLEAELVEAKHAAELANEVKTQFMANISHELRTPLNAILGFSEIIAKELFGPAGNTAYVGYAEDVRKAGQHLLAVINDVLDIAQIETGGLTLHESAIDVGQAIAAALSMVSLPAHAKKLEISTTVAPGLPSLTADERRFRQVLLNLLANAVKYTAEGGRIAIEAAPTEEGGLQIVIADTGIGIAPEDMESVLKPFGRAHSTVARAYEGAGLGLPLSKALMESHGGRLAVESALGQGTTVRIGFPARRLGSLR